MHWPSPPRLEDCVTRQEKDKPTRVAIGMPEWTVCDWLAALDDFRNWLIREAA